MFVILFAALWPTCSRTTFAACHRVMSASRNAAATHHGAHARNLSSAQPPPNPASTTRFRLLEQHHHGKIGIRRHGSRRQVASRGNQHGNRNVNRFSRYFFSTWRALSSIERKHHTDRVFHLTRHSGMVDPLQSIRTDVISTTSANRDPDRCGFCADGHACLPRWCRAFLYYIGMAIGRMVGSVATSDNVLNRFAIAIWVSRHRHRAKREISCEYGYS